MSIYVKEVPWMANPLVTRKQEEALFHPGGADHKQLGLTVSEGIRRTSAMPTPGRDSPEEALHDAVLSLRVALEQSLTGLYKAVTEHPEATKKYPSLQDNLPEIGRNYLNDVYPFMIGSYLWRDNQYPVFNLTGDFFHTLALTDFGDCGEEELKLPFSAFVVRLPDNTIMKNCRQIFVYQSTSVIYKHKDTSEPADYKWDNWRDERVFPCGVRNTGNRIYCYLEDRRLIHTIDISYEESLHNIVKSSIVPSEEHYGSHQIDKEFSLLCRRVICNMLLYIENHGGLPTEGVKQLGAHLPVEREHATEPRFRVGRPIKLGPQIKSIMLSNRETTTWKLSHRFIVRGHWRNQAHGKGRLERKRMFIEPHWKGPANITEAIERTYEVL